MNRVKVPGRPVPWARTATHKGRRITPKKQREHMEFIKGLAVASGGDLLEGPLRMTVTFAYEKPKAVKRRSPSVRPDLSNLLKLVEDALNHVWYEDDCQITQSYSQKIYDDEAYTLVTVERIVDASV